MAEQENKRIYYAVQQVGLKADPQSGGLKTAGFTEIHGVQSVGISTNFNLEQVFELGQLAIYENIEEIPDIEVTMNKVLDGYPLMYHLATRTADTPDLAGRSNEKSIFALGIFKDNAQSAAEDNPRSQVECSGMFVSSLSYNFPLDDNFNEDITLVGNNKLWLNDPKANAGTGIGSPGEVLFSGAFTTNNDAPLTGSAGDPPLGGVNRRENMIFNGVYNTASTSGVDSNGAYGDSDSTVLPPEVWGISDSGTNEKSNGVDFDAHISSITVSTDLGREDINELGRKGPYSRTVTFPVEVTCEIEVTSTSGDMVSATEKGILTPVAQSASFCEGDSGNLTDRTIRIATCDGTRIYLGLKNKLASVNYSGGDAGGGNVTVSYSFTTFNDFTVMHVNDPSANFDWIDRHTYLGGTE